MSFNPTQSYHTVIDLNGTIFVVQGGVYYDKYGNSYTTLPPAKEGYVAPIDATTTGVITSGTIDGAVIGGTTPAAGHFTTVSATGQVTSTVATGTPPLVIASTTSVANLVAGGNVPQTSATGSAVTPAGTTAQRDGTPVTGYFRYNSTVVNLEYWGGAAWEAVVDAPMLNAGTLPVSATTIAGTTASLTGAIIKVGNITTSGVVGTPAIVATGRSTAQTAAVASVSAFTVGAADASFEVSANVLVTVSTTHSFSVTVAYTDEGNTARSLTLNFSNLAGTFATLIANTGGAVPYEGVPMHIRCKAATTITVATSGTFTSVTYNVESIIKQTA